MTRRALLMNEVKQELADGAVLVLIRGWYWLLDNEGRSRKVNCNSAKALIAQSDLDEWKTQAWTGDRTFARLRTKPWPSELTKRTKRGQ